MTEEFENEVVCYFKKIIAAIKGLEQKIEVLEEASLTSQ